MNPLQEISFWSSKDFFLQAGFFLLELTAFIFHFIHFIPLALKTILFYLQGKFIIMRILRAFYFFSILKGFVHGYSDGGSFIHFCGRHKHRPPKVSTLRIIPAWCNFKNCVNDEVYRCMCTSNIQDRQTYVDWFWRHIEHRR